MVTGGIKIGSTTSAEEFALEMERPGCGFIARFCADDAGLGRSLLRRLTHATDHRIGAGIVLLRKKT